MSSDFLIDPKKKFKCRNFVAKYGMLFLGDVAYGIGEKKQKSIK